MPLIARKYSGNAPCNHRPAIQSEACTKLFTPLFNVIDSLVQGLGLAYRSPKLDFFWHTGVVLGRYTEIPNQYPIFRNTDTDVSIHNTENTEYRQLNTENTESRFGICRPGLRTL